MTELAGRVALVSGGSRGIGRAIAVALARHGADVAVNYRRDREAAQATVAEIEAAGRRGVALQASVDDPAQVAVMVDEALGAFGHVDILVHSAGIASRGASVADTDPDEVARVVHVHALAAHHLARCVLPSMRQRPRGDIVLISSVATDRTTAGTAPYVMGKAALEGLGRVLAAEELANGIRVNTVAPGLVTTDMGDRLVRAVTELGAAEQLDARMPFGRVTRPEDVADLVAFLVSERGGQITGQRIVVDGGGTPPLRT